MPITTIYDDSWWSARASETVTRTFPAAGYIPAAVSGWARSTARQQRLLLVGHGVRSSSHAWSAYFYSGSAKADDWHYKNLVGFAVRLFASE